MPQAPLRVAPHLTPEDLEEKYKHCTNVCNKTRWHLLWLMTKPKKTTLVTEAAETVGMCQRWARILVRRYNEGGEEALVDQRKNNTGREPLLSSEQQEKLKKTLTEERPEDGGLWTGPKVAKWITKETSQPITPQGAWLWLQKMSFSPHVPRPSHTKSATLEEQAAFKKNSKIATANSRQNMRTKR